MRGLGLTEFVWIWNRNQGLATPGLHVRIARWLERQWSGGQGLMLLLAFRNSGKSTLVGLFSAWLLFRDSNLRILVVAADHALAGKMVRNVKRIIERHPCTGTLRPRRADQWAADRFTVRRTAELRDPSMLAKGIGANVTGLRADIVICDDVEVPNTCDTLAKRIDLRQRLRELDFVLVPGGTQLFVGTPHHPFSIYGSEAYAAIGEEGPFLSGFSRLEVPLLDPEGRSNWPERFPTEAITSLRLRAGPARFESQMMLRPRSIIDGRLDADALRRYDGALVYTEANGAARLVLEERRLVSASCWWDPSFGRPDKGDASVIAAVFSDEAGDYWLHAVRYLAHDPAIVDSVDEATQLCRQVVQFLRTFHLPAVVVETNGIGRFLPTLLRRELERAGLRAGVIEHVSVRAKDIRIVDAFDAVLAAGRLHAHRSVFESRFLEELREWRPGGKCRDDGLDAVAGCLLSEPVRLPRVFPDAAGSRPGGWRPASASFRADTDFSV
ncbi:MAG: hypothetical protein EA406_09840 [Rhodospirillales bacterium]|nr:MAG: hypothetical protein EA406_09840 [Rhodospirillales bacterium]